MLNKAFVWIRDDLRVRDNPALINASLNHDRVSAVYIFNKQNFDNKREAQKWWISKSLESFREDLDKYNINLELIISEESKFFSGINNKDICVYWNKVYEPLQLDLDKKVIKILDNKKIEYKFFKGNVLNEYQTITKKDGTPFKVFSPFWRHAEQIYLERVPIKEKKLNKLKQKIDIFKSIYKPNDILPNKKWYKKFENYWNVSEKESFVQLQ